MNAGIKCTEQLARVEHQWVDRAVHAGRVVHLHTHTHTCTHICK